MSEYYKSLISDQEVIEELIKESKRREGTLPTESSRLKPNLNFFQRTVNHLVSNNKRIDKSVDKFKDDHTKHSKTKHKYSSNICKSIKLKIGHSYQKQLVKETKINFSKSIEKPYQATSIRKSNKNLIKYIEELSTDSSSSEPECIEKASLPEKYLKIDTSDSEPEINENLCENAIAESSDREPEFIDSNFKNMPKKVHSEEIICISSDDGLKGIWENEDHRKVKRRKTD